MIECPQIYSIPFSSPTLSINLYQFISLTYNDQSPTTHSPTHQYTALQHLCLVQNNAQPQLSQIHPLRPSCAGLRRHIGYQRCQILIGLPTCQSIVSNQRSHSGILWIRLSLSCQARSNRLGINQIGNLQSYQ